MRRVYVDQASTSFPKAPGVVKAMVDFLEGGGFNINRGGYSAAYQVEDMVLDTRERLCGLFGFREARNVVFTSGVTLALNYILQGFLRPGDHVIASSMEHNGVMRPLRLCEKKGVRLSLAECDGEGALDPGRVEALITAETRAVVLNHASNVCGTILPVAEVGEICRARGIRLIVDSAQSAGVLDIDMEAMGIDALCFAGHKSLGGPQGIGGFLLSPEMEPEVSATVAGGTGSQSDSEGVPRFMPDRFEAGTLNLPGIAGLRAALEGIAGRLAETREKEAALCARFMAGAQDLPGARLIGKAGAEGRMAIVSLDFPERDNAEVAYRLDRDFGVMTRCGLHCAPRAHMTLGTFPKGTVRFSFGRDNTLEEVEYCLEALRQVLD